MLRIVIETVKDRLCEGELDFRLVPQPGETQSQLKLRSSEDTRIAQLKTFWKSPDGEHSWETWLRMLIEDMLVLDAMSIYMERDKKGKDRIAPRNRWGDDQSNVDGSGIYSASA